MRGGGWLMDTGIALFASMGIVRPLSTSTSARCTPKRVLDLTRKLQRVCDSHGGRSEVRVLGGLLFMDCFCYNRASHVATLDVLQQQGATACSQNALARERGGEAVKQQHPPRQLIREA